MEWKQASRSNAPTASVSVADGRAWWLHSRVDPEDEAAYLVADVPIHERTLYVVLGFGLGYHVKALLQRVPASSRVIVIESDAAVLSDVVRAAPQCAAAWTSSPQLQVLICRDPAVLPLRLAASFSACDALALQLIPHVPSMQLTPDFFDAAMQSIREHLPAAAAAHVTGLEAMLEHDLRNFWANLASTWRGGHIDDLRDACLARPVIVVSAGPSLTAALPTLALLAERAVIVATAPTVPVLLTNGIRPDIVVTVDPFPENLAHFVPWAGVPVPLVYYQRAFHRILDFHHGPQCAFSMRDEASLPLKRDSRPSIFFPGGSVAFSALQLAHHMGGHPVVLVGQDFAFADGRTHATGVDYGRDVPDGQTAATGEQLLQVPGVSGAPVTTNGLYYSYLLHMQEYLLAYQRLRPDVRHINASSGAVILGTEHVPIEQLVARLALPSGESPARDLGERVAGASGPVDRERAAVLLRQWTNELAQVLDEDTRAASFAESFAAFERTAVHAQAASSYRRVRYVFDSRYASRGPEAAAAFRTRFSDHLRFIAETLTRLSAEYGA